MVARDITIDGDPDEVWEALTDPELLSEWLGDDGLALVEEAEPSERQRDRDRARAAARDLAAGGREASRRARRRRPGRRPPRRPRDPLPPHACADGRGDLVDGRGRRAVGRAARGARAVGRAAGRWA